MWWETHNLNEVVGPKFTNLKYLANGLNGVVFRAHMPSTNKIVAIKFINIEKTDNTTRQRLQSEIGAMQRLKGICSVEVYDSCPDVNPPYYVMEYLKYGDLRIRLKKRLATLSVLSLYLQVCQCVQKCHEMNITHRDIKPENILFRTQKGIVLADFGICKFGTLDLGTEALEMEKRGTPFYMAPEQLRDYLPQSKPADIFALGRILHFDISEKIISRPIRTRVRKIASQCTRQNISSRPNIKKLITLIENAIKAAKSLRETKPIIRRLIKISSACNDRLNKQGNNIIEIEGLYIRQRMEEFNEIVGKNSHYRTTKNWYLEEVPRYYAPYFTNIKTGLSPDEKKKSILYETKRFLAHMRKYYSDLP